MRCSVQRSVHGGIQQSLSNQGWGSRLAFNRLRLLSGDGAEEASVTDAIVDMAFEGLVPEASLAGREHQGGLQITSTASPAALEDVAFDIFMAEVSSEGARRAPDLPPFVGGIKGGSQDDDLDATTVPDVSMQVAIGSDRMVHTSDDTSSSSGNSRIGARDAPQADQCVRASGSQSRSNGGTQRVDSVGGATPGEGAVAKRAA